MGMLGWMWKGLSLRAFGGGCEEVDGDADGGTEVVWRRPTGRYVMDPDPVAPTGRYVMDPDPVAPTSMRLSDLPSKVWTPWGEAPAREEDRTPVAPYAPVKPQAQEEAPTAPVVAPARRRRPLPALPRPLPAGPEWSDWAVPAPEKKREAVVADPDRARRMGRSAYDAVETHGSYGLIDTGQMRQSVCELVAHVPKRSRGSFLSLRPGDSIQVNSARGRAVGGRLDVVYVTPHKYYSPGRAVTSCRIGVPESQWRRFVDDRVAEV